jgi:N-acyl-D-amino-acid deacylase
MRLSLASTMALSLSLVGCVDATSTDGTTEPVLGEPVQAANTNFWWYYGQTPAQVTSLLSQHNARLVSLRVESASPLLFDVAMVQNTGTYAKTWWWYYGLSEKDLNDRVTANDARLISVEPYLDGGTLKFAALMLHNVGADENGWWWYYGVSPSQITTLTQQHNARLVDLREYWNGSASTYAVVMVSNTGANQSGWWWYYNVSPQQVSQYLSQNNAYLVSLDPANGNGSAFNVVMYSYAPGFQWFWYYGQTEAQVNALWQQNHARIFDVKSYVVGGTRYFAVLMMGNGWSSTQQAEASCDANLISGWNGNPPAVGLGSSSAIASYDSVFTALMKKYGVPGGAVAVMQNGKLVLARGYGMSDTGNAQLAHPDNLFRIASLSKQITSAAVLKLVQNGKLKYSDNPFTLLGFTANPTGTQTAALSSMTIEQMLQHTGGWSRELCNNNCGTEGDPMFESESIESAQHGTSPPGCDQIIQYMLTQPVKWTPGTVNDYSNFGYCVLGAVIEKVTGQSYASWVSANILDPAGAGGIVQGRTLWPADREVVYYDGGSNQDVFATNLNAYTNPYGNFYLEAMAAHGAWVASPVDLLRFQGAVDGRTGVPALLDSTRLSDMTANPNVLTASLDQTTSTLSTVAASTASWYGMGWAVNQYGNWWHNGSLPGTATEQIHTKDGWGFAAFFNNQPGGNFPNDVDSSLWAAFNGTKSWLSTNLFDQYGAYSAWTDGSTYQSEFNAAAAAGKYPSRVEGYDATGTPHYRAVFAPFHGSAWTSHHGIDCPTYQSYASSLATQGYETASLQSYVSNDGTRRYQATWVKW